MFSVRIVIDWTVWVRLLVAPSSYLLVLALLATGIAKTVSLLALRPAVEWWALPSAVLLDRQCSWGWRGPLPGVKRLYASPPA